MRTFMKAAHEQVPELCYARIVESVDGKHEPHSRPNQWNIEFNFDDSFRIGVGVTSRMSKKEIGLLLLDMSKQLLE